MQLSQLQLLHSRHVHLQHTRHCYSGSLYYHTLAWDTALQCVAPLSDTVEVNMAPLSDIALKCVAPLSDTALQCVAPLSDTTKGFVAPLSDITFQCVAPLSYTVEDNVAPLSDIALQCVAPLSDTVLQCVAPLSDTTKGFVAPLSDITLQCVAPLSYTALQCVWRHYPTLQKIMWRHRRSTLTSFYTACCYGRQKIKTHEAVATTTNKSSVQSSVKVGSRFKIKEDTTTGGQSRTPHSIPSERKLACIWEYNTGGQKIKGRSVTGQSRQRITQQVRT